MVSVEKFGIGALRVSYGDGRADWLFWPFDEGVGCERPLILQGTIFWVCRSLGTDGIEVAIFDAARQTRLLRRRFAAESWLVTGKGQYLALYGKLDSANSGDVRRYISMCRVSSLREVARIEDDCLGHGAAFYERHDGALIAGTLGSAEPRVWKVTFTDTIPCVEEVRGVVLPSGISGLPGHGDPTGRRVATIGAETTPIEKEDGKALYGVPVKIWNLDSLRVEKTIVVDRVPVEFSASFGGQDRLKPDDEWRIEWERITDAVDPVNWDGTQLAASQAGPIVTADRQQVALRRSFISGLIRDIAWEPDGEAFWVLFAAGFLRRISLDGTVSPRYVVKYLATPPVLGKRRWRAGKFRARQEPISLRYLPNGQLRIMSRLSTVMMNLDELMSRALDDRGGAFQFDPKKFSLKGSLVHRLVSPILGPHIDGIYVSYWRDGFLPRVVPEFHLTLDSLDGRTKGMPARTRRAIERRKDRFLMEAGKPRETKIRRSEKPPRGSIRTEQDVPVAAPEAKLPLPAGRIAVEKFGYDISGALRVEYGDGSEDWMFLPFRDEDLREFHIVGDDRILAVSTREMKLYDVKSRQCVARRGGGGCQVHVAANGEWIAVVGKFSDQLTGLCMLSGQDLTELLFVEDAGISYIRPVYERYDGVLIVGSLLEGPVHAVYLVAVEDGAARYEKYDGKRLPGSYRNNWVCPGNRRVLAINEERLPVRNFGGENVCGVEFQVWGLGSLTLQRQITVEYLPRELQTGSHFGPPDWDGSLRADPSMDQQQAARLIAISRDARTFLQREVAGVLWEADGSAFWVFFAVGFLRRVSLDGRVSPRCIVERIWSPSLRTGPAQLGARPVLFADGRIRIETNDQATGKRGYVYVRPELVMARAETAGDGKDVIIRKDEDGYALQPPFGIRSNDTALIARMRAFCERAAEAPIALADMSAASCIDAIDRLTAAIDKDPFELVCGYNFRPTFVYAEGTPEERRMGEDVFFRHVAANAPGARDAIKRLLHMWMDRVPLSAKHRNYYMNEETVALSHALKALITLDPCCYDTIRRYVTELDIEHDVIIRGEVLPYFGQVNGWRDLDAIKLGIFCMLENWCGGSGGEWTDPSMRRKVMATMGGREFAELLIRETERYFSPDEATFNRQAWNHNTVHNYLQGCEICNFRTAEPFDREAVATINEFLERAKAEI